MRLSSRENLRSSSNSNARPLKIMGWRRVGLSTLLLAFVVGGGAFPAVAMDDDWTLMSAEDQKETLQQHYRELRQRKAALERAIASEWELYADANRRNYRRGKKRHVHRDRALALEVELAEVKENLDALPQTAHRVGALPGWLREVEDERIVLPPPGEVKFEYDKEKEEAEKPAAPADGVEDREGRNPLYLENVGDFEN